MNTTEEFYDPTLYILGIKEVLSSPFGMSSKWYGYESIYFLTNTLQAKAFFLYLFGKVLI